MIFDPEIYCTAAETAELDGTAPLALAGDGLWVGVLSRGACLLGGVDRPGQSGDILLGPAPLVLTPQSDCHLLAVRLTGHCTDAYLLQLGAARWADGAACPGAAELIAQLCGAQTAPMAYALLCAAAKADETARPLPPLVAEAVAAIRQNYMALYGVEELSEQLGVTKSHLVRVFKQEMGVPPGKYMTNVRIEAVKTLRLFWPENGFKSVINAVLVLYILTVGVQLVHGLDWDGLVRELRSLPDGQDTADYSDYSRELALAASVDAVREVLRNAGINAAVSWQNGVCVITPVDPRDKPAIEALLAVNAGELPWRFAEAAS